MISVYPEATIKHVLASERFRLVKMQRGGIRDNPVHRAAIFESY
jgi:hypothetical protein